MSDWNIEDVMPNGSWVDKVLPSCPYCGSKLNLDPDEQGFSVWISCGECGFGGSVHPPDDISPLKGVIKEIRL